MSPVLDQVIPLFCSVVFSIERVLVQLLLQCSLSNIVRLLYSFRTLLNISTPSSRRRFAKMVGLLVQGFYRHFYSGLVKVFFFFFQKTFH